VTSPEHQKRSAGLRQQPGLSLHERAWIKRGPFRDHGAAALANGIGAGSFLAVYR
jgi:hypothetical protein